MLLQTIFCCKIGFVAMHELSLRENTLYFSVKQMTFCKSERNLRSQIPQPILRNGLGERSPPERIIFLQRLLAPSICIVAPYLRTFLDSAGCHLKLLPWQNLRKSVQMKARAD